MLSISMSQGPCWKFLMFSCLIFGRCSPMDSSFPLRSFFQELMNPTYSCPPQNFPLFELEHISGLPSVRDPLWCGLSCHQYVKVLHCGKAHARLQGWTQKDSHLPSPVGKGTTMAGVCEAGLHKSDKLFQARKLF